MNKIHFLLLCICATACTHDIPFPAQSVVAPTRFTALSAEQTGIDFINRVEDGEQFNILTYRNFYNGGGVAIGDINRDGLNDLYFTANMTANSLFLNKGNWHFENITALSGTGGQRKWSTGVTMADINGDGWLDIYVCNSGDIEGDQRENELFINNADAAQHNGIPTFTESAQTWGLQNGGYATHASFFDADADGDLDCYLLNNSFKDPSKIDLYKKTRDERDPLGGDRLLLNQLIQPDGKSANAFIDISATAGIFGSAIGFGLGVSVSDLNGDCLPDIYISNDFWERDYLYINQGNARFKEQLTGRTGHCSVSSMGADIGDLNNDGAPDIFTTDMLAADNYRLKTMTAFDEFHLEDAKYRADFHYQILQNCLQLNDGSGNFSEIAHQSGVAATDWSWGALLFDFDNDGWKDIFVANGIYRDIMYLDFTTFINDKDEVRQKVTETGRFDWRDFAKHLPSNKLANYAFVNGHNMNFSNQAAALGLGDASHSNGAAYGDLDNDGDADLVVNNLNMPAFIYKNEAREQFSNHYLTVRFEGAPLNQWGIGARIDLVAGGQRQTAQNFNTRGFQSSSAPELQFGTGQSTVIDSVTIIWPDGRMQVLTQVAADQVLTARHSAATARYKPQDGTKVNGLFKDVSNQILPATAGHTENRYNDFDVERLLPHMLSTEGPAMASADVNGDGIADLAIGGGAGEPDRILLGQPDGRFKEMPQTALAADKPGETTSIVLFDADGDKDPDLLTGTGGNEPAPIEHYLLRYFENDGQGHFSAQKTKTPPAAGNISCLVPGDYDADGDLDLFIGGRCVPGMYGVPPTSFLMRNDGNGRWEDITTREMAAAGMVTSATWADLDEDRDLDLLIAGEWMPVVAFRNDRGKLTPALLPVLDANDNKIATEGWWNTLITNDLDNDGDQDIVLGNWGLNSKFKADVNRPLTLFVNDFDKNGRPEFILNWFTTVDDRAYPFATKPDLTAQMPFLKKKILKFEDYAHQTYETLFSAEQREKAISYTCNTLASVVLWNEGKGRWRLTALPEAAQRFPIFALAAGDFDGDGKKDLFAGGNFYGLKPEGGHLDAGAGLILKGDGKGHFNPLPASRSGISVNGEIRDVVLTPYKTGQLLLIGRNNNSMVAYKR